MDKNTLNETFDLLSIAENDTSLKRAGAYYIGPCPFCGGRDRFTLKQTAGGWRWHCRHCGDDIYHDSIAYMMRRLNLSFVDALRHMGGDLKIEGATRKTPAAIRVEIPSETWQVKAWDLVNSANERLLNSPDGAAARAYLTRRGLHCGSWNQHLMGYCGHGGRPAIVLPHFDGLDIITAVKFRYIDDRKPRYMALKGSKPLFWGLHQVYDGCPTLLLVEGELNGISISQCNPAGIAVISFGSETITAVQAALLPTLARRYRSVVIWADKAEKARAANKAVGRPAKLYKSPGMDANDMLQAGILPEFLRAIGLAVTGNKPELLEVEYGRK